MNCCKYKYSKTDEYTSLILSPEEVLHLNVIGEIYIDHTRYHAYNNYIYNDSEVQVAKIIDNVIAWY